MRGISFVVLLLVLCVLCTFELSESLRCQERHTPEECLKDDPKQPTFHARDCRYCPPEGLVVLHHESEKVKGICRNKHSSSYTPHRECFMDTETGWVEQYEQLATAKSTTQSSVKIIKSDFESFRGCWNHRTCIDCLMASDNCKFCPKTALTSTWSSWAAQRRKFEGACVHVQSTAVKASDRITSDARDELAFEGGCAINNDQVQISDHFTVANRDRFFKNGWINPSSTIDFDTARLICESYNSPTPFAYEAAKNKGGIADLDAIQAESETMYLTIFESLSRTIHKLLVLRTTDPRFHSKHFKNEEGGGGLLDQAGEQIMAFATELLDNTIPGTGNALEAQEVFSAYYPKLKAAVKGQKHSYMFHGAKAKTDLFADITYLDLYTAYLGVINRLYVKDEHKVEHFRNPKCVLLEMLKEYDDNPPTWWGPFARKVAQSTGGKVYRMTRFAALWTLAFFTGGLSVPATMALNMAIGYAESRLLEHLDLLGEIDKETRLKLFMAGMLFYEGFVTGIIKAEDLYTDRLEKECFPPKEPVTTTPPTDPLTTPEETLPKLLLFTRFEGGRKCDITEPSTCPPNYYCKREFNFFPKDPADYYKTNRESAGFCAPVMFTQSPAGSYCELHSECKTGLCAYNTVYVKKKLTVVYVQSANGKIYREPISMAHVPVLKLSEEDRLKVNSGVCRVPIKLAGKPMPPQCHALSDMHNFFSCTQDFPDLHSPPSSSPEYAQVMTTAKTTVAAEPPEIPPTLMPIFNPLTRVTTETDPLQSHFEKVDNQEKEKAKKPEPVSGDDNNYSVFERMKETYDDVLDYLTLAQVLDIDLGIKMPTGSFFYELMEPAKKADDRFAYDSPTTAHEIELQELPKTTPTGDRGKMPTVGPLPTNGAKDTTKDVTKDTKGTTKGTTKGAINPSGL